MPYFLPMSIFPIDWAIHHLPLEGRVTFSQCQKERKGEKEKERERERERERKW